MILSFTLIICLMGILKFIVWYSPKKKDHFVSYPFTLVLRKEDTEIEPDAEEFTDALLQRLTKGSSKEEMNDVKTFSLRVRINLADVADYAEWTTSRFEDEKIYADAVCVRFYDNTEMILNVPYDYFDKDFDMYLNSVK